MMTQDQLPMVAIPSMNDTHLEEMLIINRLEAAARNNNIDEVSETLKELLEHTAMHFFDEEDLMEEALFPALQTHKNEHDRHLKELNSIIKYFAERKDPKAISAYVEGNLISWSIHHMETMDSVMAKYLEEGLTAGCSATKGCTTGSC